MISVVFLREIMEKVKNNHKPVLQREGGLEIDVSSYFKECSA